MLLKSFFLIHLDFLAKIDDLAHPPHGPTELASHGPRVLVRLSLVHLSLSIALIRGRATGMGSELALACRHAFRERREKAILSQFEVRRRSGAWRCFAPWRDSVAPHGKKDEPWK